MHRCALDQALSPTYRSSHPGPVIKIAVILKFQSTWICSGSRFETLKAHGIVKLMGVHRSTQHPDSGWPCLGGQSYSTSWYEYSIFIAQLGLDIHYLKPFSRNRRRPFRDKRIQKNRVVVLYRLRRIYGVSQRCFSRGYRMPWMQTQPR